MNNYRVLFMGTPAFAVPTLELLLREGINICGVVTVPDKPAGRGQHVLSSEIKVFALRNQLTVFQPEKLNDPDFIIELQGLKPDLAVVVAFRMLPETIWSIPAMGTFNLHASLLPAYRGAAPINWALINGEKETGITTFFIDKGLDTGRIIYQEKVGIDAQMNAGDLHALLMHKGAYLVLKTVQDIFAGLVNPEPQSDIPLNLPIAPKLNRDLTRIIWRKRAIEVHNLVRGLSPYPGAWSLMNPKDGEAVQVKIFKGQVDGEVGDDLPPGTIMRDKRTLSVKCSDAWFRVLEAQWPGRKRMPVQDLLRGNPVDNSWLAV